MPEEYPTISIIIFVLSNISAIVVSIFTWVRSKKMMPKEIEKADLENLSTELSIVEQYEELASKATTKMVNVQERLDLIESNYQAMQSVMKDQMKIIEEQTERIDEQDLKIRNQSEEIRVLRCELNNAKLYNSALIKQMQNNDVIPLERSNVVLVDCNKENDK